MAASYKCSPLLTIQWETIFHCTFKVTIFRNLIEKQRYGYRQPKIQTNNYYFRCLLLQNVILCFLQNIVQFYSRYF